MIGSKVLWALMMLMFGSLAATDAVQAEESSAQRLDCPQCGAWQISSASDDWLVGNVVLIDPTQIKIPGCGKFTYTTTHADIKTDEADQRRTIYRLALALRRLTSSFLCADKDQPDWLLEADVSGHFQEGGFAEFTLRKTNDQEPSLHFQAWNMNREDPCDAGSGWGTAQCMAIETALLYRALAIQESNGTKSSHQPSLPHFSAKRFAEEVKTFCSERERESGRGLWPDAWSLICVNERYRAKLDEFKDWNICNREQPNSGRCRPPDERFSKSQEFSEEP